MKAGCSSLVPLTSRSPLAAYIASNRLSSNGSLGTQKCSRHSSSWSRRRRRRRSRSTWRSGFDVIASKGHLKDLPKNQNAVDVAKDFTEKYEVIEGKEKILEELKASGEEGRHRASRNRP
jgi:DNA topoisomerase IA